MNNSYEDLSVPGAITGEVGAAVVLTNASEFHRKADEARQAWGTPGHEKYNYVLSSNLSRLEDSAGEKIKDGEFASCYERVADESGRLRRQIS